jgi:hypothetical protein
LSIPYPFTVSYLRNVHSGGDIRRISRWSRLFEPRLERGHLPRVTDRRPTTTDAGSEFGFRKRRGWRRFALPIVLGGQNT